MKAGGPPRRSLLGWCLGPLCVVAQGKSAARGDAVDSAAAELQPLCDGNLVPCLDIDDFAAHAYAHLMVRPKTEQRGNAAMIPYGGTFGLFGRSAGGVSTSYSTWSRRSVRI